VLADAFNDKRVRLGHFRADRADIFCVFDSKGDGGLMAECFFVAEHLRFAADLKRIRAGTDFQQAHRRFAGGAQHLLGLLGGVRAFLEFRLFLRQLHGERKARGNAALAAVGFRQ